MTIPVSVEDLAAAVGRFDSAILVVTPPDTWPRVFTTDPEVVDGGLDVPSLPPRVVARALAHPRVTLVWQPRTRHGHALVVDGWAEPAASGAPGDLRVRVDHAVLHRPPTHADGPGWEPIRLA